MEKITKNTELKRKILQLRRQLREAVQERNEIIRHDAGNGAPLVALRDEWNIDLSLVSRIASGER